ncbi:MAG: cell surface protein [Nannocystaceae bacterium]|nr:cell surface protein [Nannocystaceae bacterium]
MTSSRITVLLLALAACDPSEPLDIASVETQGVVDTPVQGVCPQGDQGDAWADCVEAFEPGTEAAFGHDALPEVVLGPPMPPASGGSMYVVSLGCGGSITLAFDPPGIVDAPGDDLIVYENPFATGDTTFAEPARVLVSEDGEDWRAFACELTGVGDWPPQGCAGITPVSPAGDGFEGGDGFDLADVGLAHARYVRLVDVSSAFYGDEVWCSGEPGGFDLDAVEAVPG